MRHGLRHGLGGGLARGLARGLGNDRATMRRAGRRNGRSGLPRRTRRNARRGARCIHGSLVRGGRRRSTRRTRERRIGRILLGMSCCRHRFAGGTRCGSVWRADLRVDLADRRRTPAARTSHQRTTDALRLRSDCRARSPRRREPRSVAEDGISRGGPRRDTEIGSATDGRGRTSPSGHGCSRVVRAKRERSRAGLQTSIARTDSQEQAPR